MKFLPLLLLLQSQTAQVQNPQLIDLYQRHEFFALRDALPRAQTGEAAFLRGAVANKFNRLEESVRELNRYLALPEKQRVRKLSAQAQELLFDAYPKAYEYKKAAEAGQRLIKEYADVLTPTQRQDTENSVRLWSALADVPKQTVSIEGDTSLKIDKGIGWRIPVVVNGKEYPFIFDTGANISVLSLSYAKELGAKLIPAKIQVGGISGSFVQSQLGHLPEMRIGKAVVRDTVFLVMDDKDLNIQGHQLTSILGYPVISALKEITLTREGELKVPARQLSTGEQNLAIDGLMPLMLGRYKDQALTFAFDTGASGTFLYPPFYKRFEAEIKDKYERIEHRVQGVGTHRMIPAFRMTDVSITVGGNAGTLAKVPVLTQETSDKSRHFYGNVGQDFISQFPSVTMNFERMSIEFGRR